MTSSFGRFLQRLLDLQVRRPFVILLLAIASAVPAYLLARNLELRTGFGELLPDDSPSVIELRRTNERLSGLSTLAITAESKNTDLLKRFVEDLAPKLRALPKDLVISVDEGPKEVHRFFEENKHLYADVEDIEDIHSQVVARYDWEVGNQLGMNLEEEAPPRVTAESIEARFAEKLEDAKKKSPGVDGYYIGENGTFAAILVRTPLGSMDQGAFRIQEKIRELIEAGNWEKQDPEFRYGFTGNLITSAEQYRDVVDDLTSIGITGLLLVLGIVYLFFFRVRTVVSMGICISLGCLWCFAFAELAIGHLNTATGFLMSVIAGNGINAMVIYMARYMEARRQQRMALPDALRAASTETYGATLSAVAVSVVAYGALMTTEFRGFRHFGVIGAAGMLLCWLSTYLVLPSVLTLMERLRPFKEELGWRDRLGGQYSKPFVWISKRYPIPLAIFGTLTALGGAFCTYEYFSGDPMEYNLHNIRNERSSPTSAGRLASRVNKVAGLLNQNGRAVLVDRLDQVDPLVKELERRREAAPADLKPFGEVASIYSLMPKDQARKIELLEEIDDRVDRAHRRKFISDEEYAKVREHLPEKVVPVTMESLPERIAYAFEEKDGTRGRIVYVAPTEGRSLYDARYLMLWADSFREVKLPNGDIIRGTGDAVVFSDMLKRIGEDAPRVALLSFLGTMGVILFAFRGRIGGWTALATLALGVSWLISALFLSDVRLNFLNFIALPIAIGVGSDYAINVLKRRELEGDAGIERAFLETGGAVVACSMTTLTGYSALMLSVNGAVRSLGFAAAIGEAATQLSAMLVLPAFLYWAARRRAQKAEAPPVGVPEV